MELFDLNSNLNSLFESSSVKDFLVDFSVNFLVDFLKCLCVSFIALKILKSSSSKSTLINYNQVLFLMLFVFVFHGPYFYLYDLFHQLLVQVYSHEDKDQFYTLRHSIEFAYFILQMHPLLNVMSY